MVLKEYILNLMKMGNAKKGNMELEVIYSSDDEGNNFDKVRFTPTLGDFQGSNFDDENGKVNSICIN